MDLRPLTLGELLDRAFTLYRRHVWLFVGIMAVPSVLALASAVTIQALQWRLRPGAAPPSPEAAVPIVLGVLSAVTIGALAYMVVYVVALGATTVAVSEFYVGRSTTIAAAFAHVRRHIGRLLLLMVLILVRVAGVSIGAGAVLVLAGGLAALITPVLTLLLTFLGMILLFVACGYLMLRYSLAVPALVLEGLTASESLRRSVALVDGAKWRVLLLGVCTIMVWYAR